MKKFLSAISLSALILMLVSCKSYTIPIDSFKEQLVNTNSSNQKTVTINNPLYYGNISYAANNIDKIIVLDKNGNEKTLNNSGSIEMRITHKNGKKYHMYFDTVLLENDTLKGSRSRFLQHLKRQIHIDSISKIEVQDGKKDFRYQN